MLASGLLGGCLISPAGRDAQRQSIEREGQIYAAPATQRSLPELSENPHWRDVLHRAFLANGDLEAAYFDWKAAVERVDVASAFPNTNLQLGFDYMFSSENMKSWDRATFSAGFDPVPMLPNKVGQAGVVALDQARAAGERFRAAKFELQRRVLNAYLDVALEQEQLRIQRDNVELLRLVSSSAENRVQAGGAQQDLLKAQIEFRLAENSLASLENQAQVSRAMLNGMLGRAADAPLAVAALPAPRPLNADDAALIAVGVDRNPELGALAHDVAGRADALELARMAYLPDISPTAAFTGSISQSLGAMLMLPTAIPMIRAQVNEARAMLRSSQATALQARRDRAASFVAAVYALRNAERQVSLFEQRILSVAQQSLDSSRQAYGAATVGFVELVDAQRTLLDVRLMIAEARIERERRLAEIEALAGVDLETLSTAN